MPFVNEDAHLFGRITIDPERCGGRPCIRGMRIRVTDILEMYAAGLRAEEILEEIPDLVEADLRAALVYAARNPQAELPFHAFP
jgi:uncharacterized protein (DUF433 family)